MGTYDCASGHLWPNSGHEQGQIVANSVDGQGILELVRHLDYRLHEWEARLPEETRYSEANLAAFRRLDLSGCFVALHLGYHHYATLLYFHSLDVDQSSAFYSKSFLEKCKFHAYSYSDLLCTSRITPNCEAVYATVAHMALVSSAVLLHTLSFGEEHELATARQCLSNNFEAIDKLRNYWPSLKSTVSRSEHPKSIKATLLIT